MGVIEPAICASILNTLYLDKYIKEFIVIINLNKIIALKYKTTINICLENFLVLIHQVQVRDTLTL